MIAGTGPFWERVMGGAARRALARPRATLALAAAIALAALALTFTRLELRTSNLDLLDPAIPEIVAFRAFAVAFGTPNALVVALEGGTLEARELAAARAAKALSDAPGTLRVIARPPFRDELLAALGLPRGFATRDRSMLFLFVQPADAESAATTIAPFVEGVRARLAALGLERDGIRFGTTGLPQYALDDRDVVRRDIARWSTLSFVAILALFAAGFGGVRRPLLAMAVLAWAALVTAGVAALAPGHLTLVSAFFFSILFGLGIDFGVHLLDRAEQLEEAGSARAQALERAVVDLAPGLGTGATTTALSFLVLLVSGFRGFAELGWLAGVGVAVALAGMITLLPALLVLVPAPRMRTPGGRARRSATNGIGRALVAMQHRGVALLLAGLAIAGGLWVALTGAPRFDGDYLALQPAASEAVRLERRMSAESELSPQFAAFVVPDAGAAATLAARLRREPAVASVRALPDYDRVVALGGVGEAQRGEWESFRSLHAAPDGRQAVYAYPKGDIWDEPTRATFLEAMRAIDPAVTGMPVLAELFLERSRRALRVTAALAAALLLLFVLADLRQPLRAALALAPTVLAMAALLALQRLLGIDFNPLDLLALPVILGVSEDAGVHLVHRFVAEGGDLARTLAGAGRSILLAGLTTLIGFGALAGANHRGLASLAQLLALGVALSLTFTLLVLPPALAAARRKLLGGARAVPRTRLAAQPREGLG